jgi:hypothetical protein
MLILLIVHTVVSFYVFQTNSVWSILPPFKDLFVYQIFSDLGVSLSIVFLFLYREIKRKGKSLKPLMLCGFCTLLLGSFSPLVFLLIDSDLFE